MIRFKLVRKSIGALPTSVKLDKETLEQIGKVAAGSIIDNIEKQRQAEGGRLQRNAPSTRAMKRKLGLPQLSLVFKKKRFVSGGAWNVNVPFSRRSVRISPKSADLKRLVRSVQQKGYLGWFGVNKRGMAAVRKVVHDFIRKKIKEAKAKKRTKVY